MALTLKPIYDRILIRRIEEKEQIQSGIIIPDVAKQKSQEAEVIATGEGKVLENGTTLKMIVKPGNRVIFGKYSGTEVKVNGEELLIIREDEVLGIVENVPS